MLTEAKIKEFMAKNNGYFIMKEADSLGVSRQTYFEIVKRMGLIKVAPGIYAESEEYADALFLISSRNPGIVFSGETALYLHNLTEKEPVNPTCTVKFGYNATHLRNKGVKVYSERDGHFEDGIIDIRTEKENLVKCYDLERSVCQMIKEKSSYPLDVFLKVIKTYMSRKDRDIERLIEYSKWMKNEEVVRIYVEVLNNDSSLD